jgi:hypothetical protein
MNLTGIPLTQQEKRGFEKIGEIIKLDQKIFEQFKDMALQQCKKFYK